MSFLFLFVAIRAVSGAVGSGRSGTAKPGLVKGGVAGVFCPGGGGEVLSYKPRLSWNTPDPISADFGEKIRNTFLKSSPQANFGGG